MHIPDLLGINAVEGKRNPQIIDVQVRNTSSHHQKNFSVSPMVNSDFVRVMVTYLLALTEREGFFTQENFRLFDIDSPNCASFILDEIESVLVDFIDAFFVQEDDACPECTTQMAALSSLDAAYSAALDYVFNTLRGVAVMEVNKRLRIQRDQLRLIEGQVLLMNKLSTEIIRQISDRILFAHQRTR
jgi:hypothetical protein